MKLYTLNSLSVPCPAQDIFPFLRESGHIVSLVGAGGKTTLLYELAHLASFRGFRTLVTTTTHIFEPQNGCFACSEDEMLRLWENKQPAVVGTRTENGKLTCLPPERLRYYMEKADLVLIEADGAKRMPCKAPRSHEPALLPECDTVLSVFGLKSIGKPLESVCFGLEEAKQILGLDKSGHLLTPADAVTLLSSFDGGRKHVGSRSFFVMLHQCDIPHGMDCGAEISKALLEKGITAFLSCET